MNMIEKLIAINKDEYFDPYFLCNEARNWPEIPLYEDYDEDGNPIPEDDPEMEPLDLENWKVTEVGDRHLVIKGGGDWQEPHEVKIELNSNDELEVVSFSDTDYGVGDEIDMNELLGFSDEDED